MFYPVIEVDSITGWVDTLVGSVEIGGQRPRDGMVMVVHMVKLHCPCTQLQQRSRLQFHVTNEPHDQRIVTQRKITQRSDEYQSCKLLTHMYI